MKENLRATSHPVSGPVRRNRLAKQVGANLRTRCAEEEVSRLKSLIDSRNKEVVKLTEALKAETHWRRLAEEARLQLGLIVEYSEDAVIGKTLDSVVTSWNAAAERMFGYSAEEVIGRPVTILFPPERVYEERIILENVREWGLVENYETVRLTKDGRRIDVSITVSPIRDLAGNVIGLSSIKRNITRRKQIEAALDAYMLQLEQSNRALQEFASTASHDLQEPLRKIKTFTGRLKERYGKALDSTAQDYLERIMCATDRMGKLILDLLSYSQITTEARLFDTVDLQALVPEVTSDLEARIEETGGCVELGNLPAIQADANQMRQLFQNLIGNALKYHGHDKPLIRVYAQPSQKEDYCRIIVEDNGIGFDEEHAERIFMLFERLHGRNEYEGTGIGLAICKRIVERHGGTITASSAPGKGSTFTITLPIHQTDG